MVQFVYGLSKAFSGLTTKDANTLYFLTDTKQIYKGDALVSDSFVRFTSEEPLPETTEEGYLYVYTNQITSEVTLWIKSGSTLLKVGGNSRWDGSTSGDIGFYSCSLLEYLNLESRNENVLYFITDAGKIFKGDTDVTSLVSRVSEFPEVNAAVSGKIYVGPAPTDSDSGNELRILLGDAWVTINPGYYTDGANWATADSGKLATIGLIKKAISETVSSLSLDTTFSPETGEVKVGNGTAAVLTGVAHGITYDSDQLKITIPQYGSEDIVVDIAKDRFVKAGKYYEDYPETNPTHHKVVVLEVENGDPVIIPAESLIDIYTADNEGKNIKIAITEDNKISASLVIDPAEGNALTYSPDTGFMVDVSDKINKIVDGTTDNLVIVADNGSIKDSGAKVGGNKLSDAPDAQTLATEKAVVDALSWVEIV